MAIGGVKSKETRSYQKGKCNSPILSICILKCVQWYTNYPIHFVASYLIPGVSI